MCQRIAIVSANLLLLVCVSGCGSSYDSSVTGTVTFKGAPLQTGTITFFPTGLGPAAYGRIQDDGSFALNTGREEGLPPGEYVVTVVATEMPEGWDPSKPPPIGKLITPKRYGDVKTSDLRYTVEPGANDFAITLEDKELPGRR